MADNQHTYFTHMIPYGGKCPLVIPHGTVPPPPSPPIISVSTRHKNRRASTSAYTAVPGLDRLDSRSGHGSTHGNPPSGSRYRQTSYVTRFRHIPSVSVSTVTHGYWSPWYRTVCRSSPLRFLPVSYDNLTTEMEALRRY